MIQPAFQDKTSLLGGCLDPQSLTRARKVEIACAEAVHARTPQGSRTASNEGAAGTNLSFERGSARSSPAWTSVKNLADKTTHDVR